MNFRHIRSRLKLRLRREVATRVFGRPVVMHNPQPVISFTFDDFPRSALLQGGAILQAHGAAGTFFASLGLTGSVGPSGEMFSLADLEELVRQKHELGSHTYDHYHAWDTAPSEFEASIIRNREALEGHVPGALFRTFSYPMSCPRPDTKRRTGRHFSCCRGGGQHFNAGTADLSFLKAFFIEQGKDNVRAIEQLISQNASQNGWLLFATHDVSGSPSHFGCTPGMLEKIVRAAVQSGAMVLPVYEALQVVTGIPSQHYVA